ncbi:Thaumatin protein 1 [Spatholobus suberectus]|nr:Thaumatin protein 1 [Spatholobus suberectus]
MARRTGGLPIPSCRGSVLVFYPIDVNDWNNSAHVVSLSLILAGSVDGRQLALHLLGSCLVTFTITNKCSYTVWPSISPGAGASSLFTTGFALQPGESNAVAVPPAWSGRLWGRTLCSYDITGKFSCITGDCGSSTVECGGGNPTLPVTQAEFTLNGADGLDSFHVSLVDGFNLPMRVEPAGGTGAGNCRATGCVVDLNVACPTELKVIRDGEGVACKSTCQAEPCNSSLPSEFFKNACPGARVDVNDPTSFTCVAANYIITFCSTSYASSIMPGNGKHPSHFLWIIIAVAVVAFVVGLLFGLLISRICCGGTRPMNFNHRQIILFQRSRAETIAPNPGGNSNNITLQSMFDAVGRYFCR